MPNLLDATQKECFTGAMMDHFDTFKKPIVINREPKKVITTVNVGNTMYGYDNEHQEDNISYVHESGSYDAMIVAPNEMQTRRLGQLPMSEERGTITIKVLEEARNYIKEKKVESIDWEDKRFNLDNEDAPLVYAGLVFYRFRLRETL